MTKGAYGLARVAPPAVGEQAVAVRSLDVLRVVQRAPWELGERPAGLVRALHLHTEAALLRHARIEAAEVIDITDDDMKI